MECEQKTRDIQQLHLSQNTRWTAEEEIISAGTRGFEGSCGSGFRVGPN